MNEYEQRKFDGLVNAAESIIQSFSWDSTPEGHKYWKEVHGKLINMARGVKLDARTVSQFDIKLGTNFKFVGESIRDKSNPDAVFQSIGVSGMIASNPGGFFIDLEDNTVYEFYSDSDEALVVIDG
jgi:hypothetical protein